MELTFHQNTPENQLPRQEAFTLATVTVSEAQSMVL